MTEIKLIINTVEFRHFYPEGSSAASWGRGGGASSINKHKIIILSEGGGYFDVPGLNYPSGPSLEFNTNYDKSLLSLAQRFLFLKLLLKKILLSR